MDFQRPDRGGKEEGSGRVGGSAKETDLKRKRKQQSHQLQHLDDGADQTAATSVASASTMTTTAHAHAHALAVPPAAMTTTTTPVVRTEEQKQRQALQRRTRQLSLSVLASFVLLIITAIPASVLACIGLLMSCWAGLLYTLYQRAMLEYDVSVRNGEGLGRFLPDSLYQQLVHQSLHEWLTASSSVSNSVGEYSFLGIYFMPGLSQEHIERHVNRLVPRHRRFLNQRGLAQHIPVLGNDLMRLLIGQRRYEQLGYAPRPQIASRGAVMIEEDDSLESIDSAVDDDDHMGEHTRRNLPRTIDTQPANNRDIRVVARGGILVDPDEENDDDDDDEDLSAEAVVLSDAISDGVSALTGYIYDFTMSTARQLTSQSIRLMARQLQRVGTVSALASMTIGAVGFGLGVYRPNERRTSASLPAMATYFPPGTFVVSTFLASGFTAGIVRTMLDYSSSSSSSTTKQDKSKTKEGNAKQK